MKGEAIFEEGYSGVFSTSWKRHYDNDQVNASAQSMIGKGDADNAT